MHSGCIKRDWKTKSKNMPKDIRMWEFSMFARLVLVESLPSRWSTNSETEAASFANSTTPWNPLKFPDPLSFPTKGTARSAREGGPLSSANSLGFSCAVNEESPAAGAKEATHLKAVHRRPDGPGGLSRLGAAQAAKQVILLGDQWEAVVNKTIHYLHCSGKLDRFGL